MTNRLGPLLQRLLDERGETAQHFAERNDLNGSGIYQIIRGERQYVTDRTLDKIATGLNMSRAELAAAMDGGHSELAADEIELLASYRSMPAEKRPTVKEIINALAVQPTQRPANRRRDALDNRPPTAGRKLVPGRPNQGDQGINRPITPDYARAGNHVRATIAVVKGWLAAPLHRPMLPTAG